MTDTRRPYLDLKKAMTELDYSPTAAIKRAVVQESEFEKPYNAADYRTMHLRLPTPDWGPESIVPKTRSVTYKGVKFQRRGFSTISGPEKNRGDTDPGCKYCVIMCYDITDCSQPFECHAAVFCTTDPSGNCNDCSDETILNEKHVLQYSGDFAAWGPTQGMHSAEILGPWLVRVQKGWMKSIEEGGYVSGPGIRIFPDSNYSEHEYLVRFTDGLKNKCYATVKTLCCSDNLAFDDASTTDTIVRNSSIPIYITGGCPPFTWSVAGTGFSIPATTNARVNTLSADGTACGVATVTITDSYRTPRTVEAKIKCTTGAWGAATNGCILSGAADAWTWSNPILSGVKTGTIYKQSQQLHWRGDCLCTSGPTCPEGSTCYATSCTSCLVVDSTAGEWAYAVDSAQVCTWLKAYGSATWCHCYNNQTLTYQEWGC